MNADTIRVLHEFIMNCGYMLDWTNDGDADVMCEIFKQINTCSLIFWGAIFVALFVMTITKKCKVLNADENSSVGIKLASLIVEIMLITITIMAFYNLVQIILAPEYYAYKQLVNMVIY